MHRIADGYERIVRPRHVVAAGVVLAAVVALLWWPRERRCVPAPTLPELPVATWGAQVQPGATAGAEPARTAVAGEARYFYFGRYSRDVACSFPDLPTDGYYISVSTADYGNAEECGSVLEVEGPRGRIMAQVVDRCPGCKPGAYDLSATAFARVADPAAGVAAIRLGRMRDAQPTPLYYRVKPGSSEHWLGLVFGGNGNPIRQVAVRSESGADWRLLTRGLDNYWTLSGAGPGPFVALVIDAYGTRVEIPGVAVVPGAVRHTDIRLTAPPASPEAQPVPLPPLPAPTARRALGQCR